MADDSSEQITGRYLIEAILSFMFLAILLYFLSGSYVIDKTRVAYELLDFSYAISTAMSIPASLFIKMPFTHDDEIKYQYNQDHNSIAMYMKKFKFVNIQDQDLKIIYNKKYRILKNEFLEDLYFTKHNSLYLSNYKKINDTLCPHAKITKKIRLIPKTNSDNLIISKILKNKFPLKIVEKAEFSVVKNGDLNNGILNILISEDDPKVIYSYNKLYSPYACIISRAISSIPLPNDNINYMEVDLEAENIKDFVDILRRI